MPYYKLVNVSDDQLNALLNSFKTEWDHLGSAMPSRPELDRDSVTREIFNRRSGALISLNAIAQDSDITDKSVALHILQTALSLISPNVETDFKNTLDTHHDSLVSSNALKKWSFNDIYIADSRIKFWGFLLLTLTLGSMFTAGIVILALFGTGASYWLVYAILGAAALMFFGLASIEIRDTCCDTKCGKIFDYRTAIKDTTRSWERLPVPAPPLVPEPTAEEVWSEKILSGEANKKKNADEISSSEVTLTLGPISPSPASASFHGEFTWIPQDQLQLGEELGRGGYGVVYAGQWQGSAVAVKELQAVQLSDEAKGDMIQEARKMANFRHPHVIQLYGICQKNRYGGYSLVMELMPRNSLYQLLHDEKKDGKKEELPWITRYSIAADVASGLWHLHDQGIIHCDVKSLNVLLDGSLRAKLTDFGLSRLKTEIRSSKISQASGTAAWMAPELCERKTAKPTAASDVYSYGMVLWELASREVPFKDAQDQQIMISWIRRGEQEKIPSDCDNEFAETIRKCWKPAATRPTAELLANSMRGLFERRQLQQDAKGKKPVYVDSFNVAAAGVAGPSH